MSTDCPWSIDTIRLAGVLSTSDVLEAAAESAEADERNDLFEQTLVSEIMTSRIRR
jgi:hypothetical protein